MPLQSLSQTQQIASILGGQSASQYFGQQGEFLGSIGIDPDMPVTDDEVRISGLLRPTSLVKIDNVTGDPYWIITNPKTSDIYVYCNTGKFYKINYALTTITEITTLATASGNGAEYYDNYIYLATNTNVARYGPLDGSPSMTTNFWTSTMSNPALSNTTYPSLLGKQMPNHCMLRLGDNQLYFCDVVNNKGVLHKIKTKKTTVEGDTLDTGFTTLAIATVSRARNGSNVATLITGTAHGLISNAVLTISGLGGTGYNVSGVTITVVDDFTFTYSSTGSLETTTADTGGIITVSNSYMVLDFPYGFYPTCLEEYQANVMTGLIEGTSSYTKQKKAEIAFWDTTAVSFSTPILLENPIVSAMKNINGILHIFSGNLNGGTRVQKYLGGRSVQELTFHETSYIPLAGAVDSDLGRFIYGSATNYPKSAPCVFANGSKNGKLPMGIHSILRPTSAGANGMVTALKYISQSDFSDTQPLVGWGDDTLKGIDCQGLIYSNKNLWRSEVFKVGRPFTLDKLRIPLSDAIKANTELRVNIYIDDITFIPATSMMLGKTYIIKTIGTTTFTNFGAGANTVDTVFTATGAGTGTGVVFAPVYTKLVNNAGEYSGKRNLIFRFDMPYNITAEHNIFFEIMWTANNTNLICVSLPINFDYTLLDD